ncbi:MAG: DAK2 domain-containing protein [Selenomonas sp.]|uniref:DAK2 domain-containing protein n=1 Tax=Selenomonas sp. TaxID=2053611 RepID=UPI0025E2A8B1|nr:DAK2 domain-containing protein [Selenomonas sp.]MCI6232719.1 DAK2 domain-containing protein [Selenomonas sp.]
MSGNKEVITGSDFKRMVMGAYSEFLLEYENINALRGGGTLPGTHVLRTMAAAVQPLADTKDDGIGGLSRRVATAAVFGARGQAGVVLAQLFRGIGKGLLGKYNATSSEFGKAFQYGILYAQRVLPEGEERPIITVAKAVAKGAYHAVRANVPITEILAAAIDAGEDALTRIGREDAGARIMFNFLSGCMKGLDGNFVSPAMSLSLGLEAQSGMPDPRVDQVAPYCMQMRVKNATADTDALRAQLKELATFVQLSRQHGGVEIHLHTNHPGAVLEQAVGWGPLRDMRVTNMSETHALASQDAVMRVACVAVAEDADDGKAWQKAGAHVVVAGSPGSCPSVSELVNAAHSDLAESYILVSSCKDYRLVFRQARRLLGARVELVLTESPEAAKKALAAFDDTKTAAENAKAMRAAAGI